MVASNTTIQKIKKLAREKYPDAEIYLYGLQARGEAQPLSDWDILVLIDSEFVPFSIETGMMDEFYEIELETGEIISPLIYPKEDWRNNHSHTPLFENIEKEAIRLV